MVQIKGWKKIRERNGSLEIMENFLFQDSAPGQLVGESSFNHICIPSTYCQTVYIERGGLCNGETLQTESAAEKGGGKLR